MCAEKQKHNAVPRPLTRWLLMLFWSAVITTPAQSIAATQGNTSSNSTATTDVTVVLGYSARITGFSDMALGTWPGTGVLSANDNLCVGLWGTRDYRIRQMVTAFRVTLAPLYSATVPTQSATGSISATAYRPLHRSSYKADRH